MWRPELGAGKGPNMPAQLIALTEGPNILLDKPILLLGRHPECDIQIESRKISRRHCCIAQVHDYLVVRDLGSTNGVRINGVRVLEGKLKGGDELMIGGCRYQVCWDVLAGRPAAGAVPRPAPRPPPVRADDDALVEKYDEPVPLVDPGESVPMEEPAAPRAGPEAPPPAESNPPILPDHIGLASSSEIDLPPQRPPT